MSLNFDFWAPPYDYHPTYQSNISAKALLCQLLLSVKRVNAWKRSRFMQFDDMGQYVGYASRLLTLVGRILWLTRHSIRQETGALKTF